MADAGSFTTPAVPKFDGDYDHWSLIMENLLRSKEYWCIIQPGFEDLRSIETPTPAQQRALDEAKLKDLKAKNYLFQSIDKTTLKTITQKETAKQLWESMKIKHQGSARVKRAQLQRLRKTFETLEMKSGEGVASYFARVMEITNDMRNCGEAIDDVKIVEKILRSLTENFNFVVCSIEESKDIDDLTVDELQASLQIHESKVIEKRSEEQVLQVENEPRNGRGRGRWTRGGSSFRGRGRGRSFVNRSAINCFRCGKQGHYQFECTSLEKGVNYVEFDEEEELLLMAHTDISKAEGKGIWFLDSGCSNHMTGEKSWFIELDEGFKHSVRLGNGSRLPVEGKGKVRFEVEGILQVVSDVYYVPNLTNNLLSVGQLQEKQLTILIKGGRCKIYHQQKGLILETQMTINRMFLVYAMKRPISGSCFKLEEEDLENLWHRRFGHLNNKSIQLMQRKQMVKGLPNLKDEVKVCTVCNIGKQQRGKFPKKSKWRASEKLELIHADLCGPITPISQSGKRYLLVLVDDFCRKTWIYFLVDKSEAFETFKSFKNSVEKEAKTVIRGLRTDRGGEFTSDKFNKFCRDHGIKRQLTAAYTPQQNGVAERRNRTIMNMVRCLLSEKEMPRFLWPDAARWTAYVLNRSFTKAVTGMVPEERWSGFKPRVDYFRVFGSVAHVHVPEQRRIKLDDRSQKCILLGVSEESKAYRLYDPSTKKIVVSRDVFFEEDAKWEWNTSTAEQNTLSWGDDGALDGEETDEEDNGEEEAEEATEIENAEVDSGAEEETTEAVVGTEPANEAQPRRERRQPSWMQDFVIGEEETGINFALYICNDDPLHFFEAAKEEKWREAMKLEIQSIERNNTWELVHLPPHAKKIGVKWVYKTKLNEEGKVEKCKARLVAKGYSQTAGVDYTEVFAPVARWDTIRSLLAVAAQQGWYVYQLDVKSAFLYGELKEEVYVDQPEGFLKVGEEDKVYRLKKALYGLKQAPRAWFSRIESYFKKEGFEKSSYDHTLFFKKTEKKILVVSLYVDDLIFTGNDESMCAEFKSSMQREFEMTDMGKMKFFLGVEVHQSSDGIHISQKKYAKEVLERFDMWNCNSVKNPIVPGTIVSREGSRGANATLYKQLVGCLMYLTVTRPDLMFVVCLIARFMADPKEEHMMIAKRVLRYLKGTMGFGVFYGKSPKLNLLGYTDSDYARDMDDRKSTSGYVFLLNGAAICWSSRKQDIVTLSSTEAEYVAATSSACHCVWLKGILQEIGVLGDECIDIMCDNSSTIKLSKNPVMHRRTKHIDVRYHYLRNLSNEEVMKLVFCGTNEQVADILTKPIKLDQFEKLRGLLGVRRLED
ncbi:unnamed protein product [Microthlaspi erraticum]|uniref:Retrovirus-related Pol polyprotein from transposon TNT 1-94 n=1 Tax=Microthlaspi erraticum TaxID=1685480 RepID=A0A6D2KR48_9BRAS|nr:unnamed protein product [Microthlaspi erraticum]CAA7026645.1 unnamed protein product [Microthlaspi erraticum]CAA7054855.1 unnamed protein product [Microthlaspi erraticum]